MVLHCEAVTGVTIFEHEGVQYNMAALADYSLTELATVDAESE